MAPVDRLRRLSSYYDASITNGQGTVFKAAAVRKQAAPAPTPAPADTSGTDTGTGGTAPAPEPAPADTTPTDPTATTDPGTTG